MKKTFLLFLFACASLAIFAQNYALGHHSDHYIDASRSNRDVWTEVYYPANAAGNDVPMANGQFPVIVFGHGFTIAWSNYDYMWQYFVPKGYICVFPRTEGGIIPAPNHLSFGLDLAFLSNLFVNTLNTTAGNIFMGHVAGETCIAGHSMGGGAAYLGCAGNTQVTTMVTMSGAETNPLASDSAMLVNVPSLVIVGGNDCVAPAATNSQLFYNNLPNSICKYYVNLTQGSHCAFAGSGASTCYSAEGLQCPTATYITAQQQRDRTLMVWEPWLRYYLKRDCAGWTDFTANIATMTTATEITEAHNCTQTVPNPTISPANVALCPGETAILTVTGGNNYSWSNGNVGSSIVVGMAGSYFASASNGVCNAISAPAVVVVNPNPAAPTITQNGNMVTCNATGVSYAWTLNGAAVGGNMATISPPSTGTILLTITDANGCQSTSSAFSFIYTSIQFPSGLATIGISPNPFVNTFSVKIETPERADFELSMTDMQGKTLFSETQNITHFWQKSYDMGELAAGIYTVTVATKNGKAVYKVVCTK